MRQRGTNAGKYVTDNYLGPECENSQVGHTRQERFQVLQQYIADAIV